MSNNFLQWNPAAVNQQDDATYVLDVMRTGGAITGIFTSELANKLFYQCTTMVSALGESLSNKGYTISDASISTLITALSNILTKADFGTTAGTACQGNDARFIPAGTKMWFYQNTAPTGWVIDSTPADAILAVKGGSAAYNVNGGMAAGTWTHPTHTHTGPLHTHTGPSHTHTGPSHAHSILTHTHTFSAGAHTHAFTGTAHTHTFSGVGSHTHTTGSLTLTAAQSGLPAHDHYLKSQGSVGIHAGVAGHTDNPTAQGTFGIIGGAKNASEAHNHGVTGAATVSGTSDGTTATGSNGAATVSGTTGAATATGSNGATAISGTTGGSNTENTGTGGTGTTSASGTGNTGAAGTGATSASSTANTWRPLAQVGIICIKS